jgi:N-acetylmuramoyl-L-alanine amidase
VRCSMRLKAGLFLLSLGLILVAPASMARARSYSAAGRVVVVDPGHGGRDPGASGHGVVEADVNLAVSRRIAEDLSRMGLVVLLTRSSRQGVVDPRLHVGNRPRRELELRVGIANAVGADAYLSIHCNYWAGAGLARGAQVFVRAGASPASRALAEAVMDNLRLGTGTRRHISERIEHYVLEHARAPAITVEMGFLSDKLDAERLADPSYQERLAGLISLGVLRYLRQVPRGLAEEGGTRPPAKKEAEVAAWSGGTSPSSACPWTSARRDAAWTWALPPSATRG